MFLLGPDDYNKVYSAIFSGEPFSVELVNDGSVTFTGSVPDADSGSLVFGHVRTNTMAYGFLSTAWQFDGLQYVCSVNGVIFAFHTPFGWAFIPPNQYAVGLLEKGFPGAYEMAIEILRNVLSPNQDQD